MILKIAICDDDEFSRNSIIKLLNSYQILREDDIKISSYSSGEELIKACKAGTNFDIVFLDIEMDTGISGIDTGVILRKIHPNPFYLIYLTNYPKYMHDSFQAHAYMYLMKPLTMDILEKTIHEITEEIRTHTSISLVVICQDSELFINIDDILYIETNSSHHSRGNIIIHTKTDNIATTGPLKIYEKKLASSNFYSPSRGFLVNLKYITASTSSEIVLVTGQHIPFSRRKRLDFQRKYTNYIMTIRW